MAGGKTEFSEMDLPSPKLSLGARIKAHLKKWWWVHVIIVIAAILVIVLPVVYVGYPKIARNDVNKSTLNVTSMIITNPSPESFHLKQTQVIGSSSSFKPTIYGFTAAVSLLGAVPWGRVQVPDVKAEDGAIVNIDEQIHLSNEAAFGGFAKAVLLNEEFDMNIYGTPKLKEGGLPKVDVTYNKTVTIKGLNKLNGFDITNFKILAKDAADGTNTEGTVYIPNPTIMSLTLGNVTMDLSTNGTQIGQAFLDNLVLSPGNNTVPMRSTVDKLKVISNLPSSSKLMLPVDIRGNTSVYHGRDLLYFSEALAANVLHTTLDVGEGLMNGM